MSRASLVGLTALVVDDSAGVRAELGLVLRDLGLRTVEAEHGLDAWRRLQQVTPDIILTDLEMPELDGLKLIGLVRRSYRRPATPVLVVSSVAAGEGCRRAERAGASAWLPKPVRADEVARAVRALLAARASRRAG